jgi:ornithine decarboxylase
VFCRVLVDCGGAEWPLSKKFGCAPEMAKDLLRKAKDWGLDAYGISFHVGSQQTDLEQWDKASARSRRCSSRSPKRASTCAWSTWAAASRRAIAPRSTASRPTARRSTRALVRHFGNRMPEVIIEPGRSMVGDAGVIQSEVVLVSRKAANDRKRWVYLDIGKFSGLAETMDESIKYRLRTARDGTRVGRSCWPARPAIRPTSSTRRPSTSCRCR